ncbi:MAG: mechanosensitive ion channel family protein [Candidatus Abyssobacteria bacterium SURF_5]|uniref:Mechanosensitive ion channel family protein n=1 Tax=Abyssobacteria bacterium (strain SURF_5) TaxID=2093360 RepID=A0A3A4NJP9_ABYX5|nr:MAG: mechanosensitive ion channel family protein [Candidatus Abyssubacteria bacterium SURF_5]
MRNAADLLSQLQWASVVESGATVILILLLALVAQAVLLKLISHLEQRLIRQKMAEGEPPSESAKRVQTLTRLLRQAALLVLWIAVGLTILPQFGVDIAPILAGAGIVGLAVGFGGQNLVRDIISGFFMILEDQVRVGDVAIVNGTGGLVEQINFRTLVLRDLTGTLHVFPNGAISTLSNMTYGWSAYVFDVGVAYKENTDRVVEMLKRICDEMRKDETFGSCIIEDAEIYGVDKFADSAVIIKGRIKTKPIRQWMVGREFLRRVKIAFDENGIEIPFPHQTVYFGEASKPFELRLLELASAKEAEQNDELDRKDG